MGTGQGWEFETERCRHLLEAHWRAPGFTVPNARTYPWQWLWDSCFHAVVWAHLGDADRARSELDAVFAHQGPTGFVPHMTYWGDPDVGTSFWGRPRTSSITQPPMFGHAVAELVRLGVEVPESTVQAAHDGLRHLLSWRARIGDLLCVVHPWETGCDDSPRWDHWLGASWDQPRWKQRKGELVATIDRLPGGVPVANADMRVAPVSFNALVAWNALELCDVAPDDTLGDAAVALAETLTARWDPDGATWVDAGDSAAGSGRVRTAEALLPALVVEDRSQLDAVATALGDHEGIGAPYGPRGVDRREPTYEPDAYWRGATWPQLTYLLWRAVQRPEFEGADHLATALAESLIDGAGRSGFAEYWDPDDAHPGGAVPQSWSTLGVAAASGREVPSPTSPPAP